MTSFDLPSVPRSNAESIERAAFLEGSIKLLDGLHEESCGFPVNGHGEHLMLSAALAQMSMTIGMLRALRSMVTCEG